MKPNLMCEPGVLCLHLLFSHLHTFKTARFGISANKTRQGSVWYKVFIHPSNCGCLAPEPERCLKHLFCSGSVWQGVGSPAREASGRRARLSSESVEGASLALERVDDIHGSHGLAASVLSVGDGVADDVLQEHLQDTAGLLVDEAADALDTSATGQTADRRLGDSGNVIPQNLAVTLGAALSESLSSLSSSRHLSKEKVRL